MIEKGQDMQKARNFSEFEAFYSLFKPLTPYGRAEKEKRQFFNDISGLKKEYSHIEAMIPIMSDKTAKDRLRYHLKNIPMLDLDYPIEPSAAELFLARKFLHNVKDIFEMLPDSAKKLFEAKWDSDALLALLDKGGDGEAFHIADCYSKELAAKRKEIQVVDSRIQEIRQNCFKNILEKYGLDFSDRDFLVMLEKNYATFGIQHDLYAEPYDFGRLIVKPVFGNDYLSCSAQRDKLRSQEAAIEKAVIMDLTKSVNADRENLVSYRDIVLRIDLAAEKARLAIDYDMIRPQISELKKNRKENCHITLKKANFIPLQTVLKKKDMEYTPFSADFTRTINILYGSNMGGKTVALKTFVFFQLLAQSGFYVPAEEFRTIIFNGICFIGGDGVEASGGLSSFGVEMNDFVQACGVLNEGSALFIMDEFARTTNSEEGAALLGSILHWLERQPGAFVFLATHLSGINAPKNTSWFRMKGFDKDSFGKFFEEKPKACLEEKLKSINRFMRYEMLPGSSENESRDAIKIAGILGVNEEIIRGAEKIISN